MLKQACEKHDGTIDEGALKDNMERTAAMEMDYFAQILVRNTFEYISFQICDRRE